MLLELELELELILVLVLLVVCFKSSSFGEIGIGNDNGIGMIGLTISWIGDSAMLSKVIPSLLIVHFIVKLSVGVGKELINSLGWVEEGVAPILNKGTISPS